TVMGSTTCVWPAGMVTVDGTTHAPGFELAVETLRSAVRDSEILTTAERRGSPSQRFAGGASVNCPASSGIAPAMRSRAQRRGWRNRCFTREFRAKGPLEPL